MLYRLGLDLGANSIGWCAYRIDDGGVPTGVLDLGVRIFSDSRDPQSKTSLAVERRGPRQQRRRRDRYLDRREGLMAALIRHGLMPSSEKDRKALAKLDPYELRGRGATEKLTLDEFGRALFHLNQRRGFKSNRKAERRKAEDSKGPKAGIGKLAGAIAASGAKTLGEYLWREHRKGRTVREMGVVRARPRRVGQRNEYDLYASRVMYEAEFDHLWSVQTRHHEALTEAARTDLRRILFFQRRLKPVPVGRCTFEPDDERAPDALPSVQRRRMLEELANLEWPGPGLARHRLTREQRDRVLAKLERQKELSFDKLRAMLQLDSSAKFNLESEKRKGLKGDQTGILLAHKERFGKAWWDLSAERRAAVVERMVEEEDENKLAAWLEGEFGFDSERARAIADAPLPDGYGRVGRIALAKILPVLEREADPKDGNGCIRYPDAVRAAGYHHSDFRTGEVFDTLPYYGQVLERHVAFGSADPADADEVRYGRIANPTVHVALNQLRKLMNVLLGAYGRPQLVVVETARELKLSIEKQREIEAEQAENQRANDKRRARLRELGVPDSYENRMRLRLWEELGDGPQDRFCVYTGEAIPIHKLFTEAVDIDHVLPFSVSLDDGVANKIVCMRRANRDKGNRAPFDAFGASPSGYSWSDIELRARSLPRSKRWRFETDAMARLAREGDFLARHLTDTGYIARLARSYLGHAVGPDKVYVVPGRLTALLRGKWGLNAILSDSNLKTRVDHRHHAIDAAVVGLTDRGLLNRVARAAEESRERLIDGMPEPWEGFRDELRDRVLAAVVSHKADHGTVGADPRTGRSRTSGRLHNDTAYGLVDDSTAEGLREVVRRVPLPALKTDKDIDSVRDLRLREALRKHLSGTEGPARQAAIEAFSKSTGTRSARITERLNVIVLRDKSGNPYKAVKGDSNHCMEVWRLPDGGWRGQILSTFDANRPDQTQRGRPHPAAKLLMRLFNDDLVRLNDREGIERLMRVVKASGQTVILASHHEGGNLKARDADKDDPFKYLSVSVGRLKELAARKVKVDEIGRVRDPGPPQ